jgi:hypothetical protein
MSTKERSDPPIAKPWPLSNQLKNLSRQPRVVILGLPYISLTRSRLIENVACPTLRVGECPLERLHGVTSRLWAR